MDWRPLTSHLFPQGYDIQERDNLLSGTATVENQTVNVMGMTHHAIIGIESSLMLARDVLQTISNYPKRPIIILIDTHGHLLSQRDERLGINRALAHLGKCIDFARRKNHKVIGVVYDEALPGSFITTGLISDACYALPEGIIRVMSPASIARFAKIPEEKLHELEATNPLFSYNVKDFWAMGAIEALWTEDLSTQLAKALKQDNSQDNRSLQGAERGGRKLTQEVIEKVLTDP